MYRKLEEKIREEFPIIKEKNYMNNGSIGPVSSTAIKSINNFLIKYSEEGPDSDTILRYIKKVMRNTRMKISKLINCDPDEVIFTQSTTHGLNCIANWIKWYHHDKIILRGGKQEHYANYFPWISIAKRKKLEIKNLETDKNGYFDLKELEKFAKEEKTRLITLSHALYNNGSIMPVNEVGDIAKRYNIMYCIDAAQTVGSIKIDVKKIRCDFMAFPAFKWICGPLGIGILYCNKKSVKMLAPNDIGNESARISSNGIIQFIKAPGRFETGFRNYLGVVGLESAAENILKIGIEKISKKNQNISSLLRTKLGEIPHIKIYGVQKSSLRTPIIPFSSKKITSKDLVKKLQKNNIIMAERNSGENEKKIVRASPHFFNDEDNVIEIINYLKKLY
ncbi:MAG: aminotransferase class V-fold PLP-dependent enzyme [Nitrososphaeraceae archaeon]